MKSERLWARPARSGLMFSLLCGVFAALPAGAQGTAEPFLKSEFYLGDGNAPPTLEQYFTAPHDYIRNRAADAALRAHIAKKLGRETLSESDFLTLYDDGRLRAEKHCSGKLETAGILPSGTVVWNTRDCYRGERLIEVDVTGNGAWEVVASQACYNPSRIPAPKPPARSCQWVQFSDANTTGTHVHADGTYHLNCCCPEHSFSTPGYSGYIPNTLQSSGGYQRCD